MITDVIYVIRSMPKKADEDSLFSESEKEIVRFLMEHPEMSHKDIADERDVARGTVNNAVARIRDKTRTAFATLLKSPHTEEVARELESEDLKQLISRLEAAQASG